MKVVRITVQWKTYEDLVPKHHAMNVYGWVKVKIHAFLTSPLDAGELSVSRSALFISGGGGTARRRY